MPLGLPKWAHLSDRDVTPVTIYQVLHLCLKSYHCFSSKVILTLPTWCQSHSSMIFFFGGAFLVNIFIEIIGDSYTGVRIKQRCPASLIQLPPMVTSYKTLKEQSHQDIDIETTHLLLYRPPQIAGTRLCGYVFLCSLITCAPVPSTWSRHNSPIPTRIRLLPVVTMPTSLPHCTHVPATLHFILTRTLLDRNCYYVPLLIDKELLILKY